MATKTKENNNAWDDDYIYDEIREITNASDECLFGKVSMYSPWNL